MVNAIRRSTVLLILAVIAVFGLLAAGPGTAQAAPTWCKSTPSTIYEQAAFGQCQGTGSYKEAIQCQNGWGWWAYREGPRVYDWSGFWPSKATCPFGYFLRNHYVLWYP